MIAAAAAAVLAAGALADTALPPVQVESGPLAGTTRDGVDRYFGIPYAAPPVGELRFRAPEPPVKWEGVRQAASFGSVCRQTVDWMKAPQSEDCLFLNIWAPAKPGKYPVIVWIHGGGFFGGSGTQSGPDAGNGIVARDVILVTINYRLGVLGFFAHPELSAESPTKASGNQGILDQIAALKWISRNIAAFGGDPGRVTIVGASAGASSVALLSMSPAAKGLFQRGIAESGGAGNLPLQADAEKRGQDFANALSAPHIADLRKLDAETLLKAPWEIEPNIDGTTLPGNMAASYSGGWHNNVPIITGWDGDEGVDLAPEAMGGKPITLAKYQGFVKAAFGPQAPTIFKVYPAASDAEAEPAAYRLMTDMMGFSAFFWGTQQVNAKAAPAYVYFFVHRPAEPATPCTYSCKAGHGSEVKYAFHQLALDPRVWNADDRAIENEMTGYWTNFAKTGDPNGEGPPKWPLFDGTPASVNVVGMDAEIKERGAFPDFRPYLNLGQ